MALYLVVAHQTAGSPELLDRLRLISTRDPNAAYTLLVPATSGSHLLVRVPGDEEEVARRRAAEAEAAMQMAGFNVSRTVIGDADPLKAIEAEHAASPEPYALTVISTFPPGLSRWLGRDLVHQVQSKLRLPVEHVITRRPDVRAGMDDPASFPAIETDGHALSLEEMALWEGREVHCADGPLGHVSEVLYDYVTREPLWVGIASHPLPFRTLFVPAATLRPENAHLRTPLRRSEVMGQPPVSVGEGFSSLTEEEALCRYFGLVFDELRDTRVLRPHQQFPGLVRNEQHILATDP